MKTDRPAVSNLPSLVQKLAFLPLVQLSLGSACVLGRVFHHSHSERVTLWLIAGQAALAVLGCGLAIAWLGRLCRVRPLSSASTRLGIAAEFLLVAVLVALVRMGLCASAIGSDDATHDLLQGRALWLIATLELALCGAAFVLVALGLVRFLDAKVRRALAGTVLRLLAWSALTGALTAFVVMLQVFGSRDLREGHPAIALGLVALACALVSAGVMAGLGRQVARRS